MNKKIMVASLGAVLSFGAFADMSTPPQGGEHGPRGGGDMMANVTEEQKSCIEQYGCAMLDKPAQGERPEKGERGEKPAQGQKPEMSAEQKESMECMQNAMKACGVEMPERPQGVQPRQ